MSWAMEQTMALSIKDRDADRLARQLAALTGETITQAVTQALKERLEREEKKREAKDILVEEIMEISRRSARWPSTTHVGQMKFLVTTSMGFLTDGDRLLSHPGHSLWCARGATHRTCAHPS